MGRLFSIKEGGLNLKSILYRVKVVDLDSSLLALLAEKGSIGQSVVAFMVNTAKAWTELDSETILELAWEHFVMSRGGIHL